MTKREIVDEFAGICSDYASGIDASFRADRLIGRIIADMPEWTTITADPETWPVEGESVMTVSDRWYGGEVVEYYGDRSKTYGDRWHPLPALPEDAP